LLNLLGGICDLFERYYNFLNVFDGIFSARNYCISNNCKELNYVEKEYYDSMKFKENFEKRLLKNVDEFNKKYEISFREIIDDFVGLIKKLNMEVINFEIFFINFFIGISNFFY